MQVESIAYTFREAEWEALLKLVADGKMPRYAFEGHADEGLTSLEKSQLVTRCGDRFLVDKLATFLAKAVECSECYVCLYAGANYSGLFYTPVVTLVIHRAGGQWVITPFQGFHDARQKLTEYAEKCSGAMTIALKNKRGEWAYEAVSVEDVRKNLPYAAQWMYFEDAPKGKDATQWKP